MTFDIKTAKTIITQFVVNNPELPAFKLEPIIRTELYNTFDTQHKLYHKTNLLRTILQIKRQLK